MEEMKVIEENNQAPKSEFDLASFKKAKDRMIATNDGAYVKNTYISLYESRLRSQTYTPEDINNIIDHGSLLEQQNLSRTYFYKDGYYKHIIIHYATILKYAGLLIPNPTLGKKLSSPHISKKYYNALDYIEIMSIPTFLTNCAVRALVDGAYYGAIVSDDLKHFSVIDLPYVYCRSNFKDEYGNDLVEFNVSYFDTIISEDDRATALKAYPKEIAQGYRRWTEAKKKKLISPWIVLSSEVGICFPIFDGRPLFLSVIPRTLEYDDAINTERERDAEEIRKIIVQKIPHMQDGRLLFEPEEAEEFHAAAVGMLKGNKNINVLTTYADVDAIGSKTSAENANNIMQRMEQNIYAEAGVTGQVFATTTATAIEESLNNDTAVMMSLANKFAIFITNRINRLFSNANITFKYIILPVTYYNTSKYVENLFKLTGSGYSFLMPAVAMGMTQRDLTSVKELENDVLKLTEKLIPLQTSYTQSSGEGGRPTKESEDKAKTTIEVEESRAKEDIT